MNWHDVKSSLSSFLTFRNDSTNPFSFLMASVTCETYVPAHIFSLRFSLVSQFVKMETSFSIHPQDRQVTQSCTSLYRSQCYTQCSLRSHNKHPKQLLVQTALGILSKALINCDSWPLCGSLTNGFHSLWGETRHIFKFSPTFQLYDTVLIPLSQRYFLRLINLLCLWTHTLFRVRVVAKQQAIISKTLESMSRAR